MKLYQYGSYPNIKRIYLNKTLGRPILGLNRGLFIDTQNKK